MLFQLIQDLQAKAEQLDWTFPNGLPARVCDPMIARCHKHDFEAADGDPAVHPDGYYEWITQARNLAYLSGCPFCARKVPCSVERAIWAASRLGLTLYNPSRISSSHTRVQVICNTCGKKTRKVYSSLIVGHGCRTCARKQAGAKRRVSEVDCAPRLAFLGARLLHLTCEQKRTEITFECALGVVHTQLWTNFRRPGRGCGCKHATSKYERIVHQLIQWWTGETWYKITKRQLRKLTGVHNPPHELDMYSARYNCAVEVDGEQHRTRAWNGQGETLTMTRKRDKARNRFCAKAGIQLLRINSEEIDEALRVDAMRSDSTPHELTRWWVRIMKQAGIRKSLIAGAFSLVFADDWHASALERCQSMALVKGGFLLSTKYLGVHVELEWKCEVEVHDSFFKTPTAVQDGIWCPQCGLAARAKNARKFKGELDDFLAEIRSAGGVTIERYRALLAPGEALEGFPKCPWLSYDLTYAVFWHLVRKGERPTKDYKIAANTAICHQLASDYEGEFLGSRCERLTDKHPWLCIKHGRFTQTPVKVRCGYWCQECGFERIAQKLKRVFCGLHEWRKECRRVGVFSQSAYYAAMRDKRFAISVTSKPDKYYAMPWVDLFQKADAVGPLGAAPKDSSRRKIKALPWQYVDEHDDFADLGSHPNRNVWRLPSGKLQAVNTASNDNACAIRPSAPMRPSKAHRR